MGVSILNTKMSMMKTKMIMLVVLAVIDPVLPAFGIMVVPPKKT
jgi:hypothetical protein